MTHIWQPGDELAGRYRLVERFAVGGGGELWRAEHLVLQSQIAIKLLARDFVGDEEMEARFQREARAVAALNSPHIVRVMDAGVHDTGVHDKVPFIAMELLVGESLSERLERGGALSFEDTRGLLAQVGRGVAHAHAQNIVHRDLKPANIFLAEESGVTVAKVLDFGVAKVIDRLSSTTVETRTGDMLGTPFYMSPEQLRGRKTIDARTDVWSLGIIAYECVVGERPFEAKTLGDLVLCVCIEPFPAPSKNADVPEGFDAWFARAAARQLAERFESCEAMMSALNAL